MSLWIKRIGASLLVIIGGVALAQMFDDPFVTMFMIACIVFVATYFNKRAQKQIKNAKLIAELEKELDEEERSEEQKKAGQDGEEPEKQEQAKIEPPTEDNN